MPLTKYLTTFLCLIILSTSTLQAQQGEIPSDQYDLSAYTAQVAHFNIAILGDNTLSIDIEQLKQDLGPYLATSWEELKMFDILFPLGGLIIDSSMVDEIDQSDLLKWYKRGVVITFFNVSSDTVSELLGIADLPIEEYPVYDEPFFITIYKFTISEYISDLTAIQLNSGESYAPNVFGVARTSSGYATDTLTTGEGYAGMVIGIILNMQSVADAKKQYLEETF